MKPYFLAAMATIALLAASNSYAGEQVANTAPVTVPSDPFSEVLKDLPTEQLSAGSSCVLLKIPLPEGMTAEEVLGQK